MRAENTERGQIRMSMQTSMALLRKMLHIVDDGFLVVVWPVATFCRWPVQFGAKC